MVTYAMQILPVTFTIFALTAPAMLYVVSVLSACLASSHFLNLSAGAQEDKSYNTIQDNFIQI